MKPFKVITTLIIFAFLITACASSTTPSTLPDSPDNISLPRTDDQVLEGTTTIIMEDFTFSPAKVTIKVGTTVTWANQDPAVHDVTASNGSFKSGALSKGESFSFLFTQPGTYAFVCTFHPGMQGEITVVP